MSAGWLQVNAALDRDAQPARHSARLAFAALGPAVDAVRAELVDGFFFQRKPPDLRLRFATRDIDLALDRLAPTFDALVDGDVFVSWHRAPYEPEWRKLGGKAPTAAYHRWADADTRLWLAFDRWCGDRLPPVVAADVRPVEDALVAQLMGSRLDGLFVDGIGDGHEVWDTWCNLLALAGDGDATIPAAIPAEVADAASAALEAPLADVASADATLDRDLRIALEAGESDTGLRATLALIAQLSLNRWGLDGPAQRSLAGTYAAARDPRAALRGGDPPG